MKSWGLSFAFLLLGALSSAAAAQNGLLGEYYTAGGTSPQPPPGSPAGTTSTATPILTRIDANVDFNFGTGTPGAPVPVDGFMVSWRGTLTITTAGNYTFQLNIDDGGRLFIDGVQVPMTNAAMATDPWVDQGATDWTSAATAMTAGAHAIRIEFYENGGDAAVHARYSGPDNMDVMGAIPTGVLTPPPPPAVPTITAVQGAGGANTVDVTWTNSGAGVTYDLQYTINGGAPISLGTALTTLAFQHTGLSYGPNYCYSVRATQGILVSAFSATDCVILIPPPPRTNGHDEGAWNDNCACGSTATGSAPLVTAMLAALALVSLLRRR